MHYFCGGVDYNKLTFTDVDRERALKLYGSPLGKFDFVE